MANRLYVVPVWIENKCGEIPRVIVRTEPGRSIARASKCECGAMERLDALRTPSAEGNVSPRHERGAFRQPELACRIVEWTGDGLAITYRCTPITPNGIP